MKIGMALWSYDLSMAKVKFFREWFDRTPRREGHIFWPAFVLLWSLHFWVDTFKEPEKMIYGWRIDFRSPWGMLSFLYKYPRWMDYNTRWTAIEFYHKHTPYWIGKDGELFFHKERVWKIKKYRLEYFPKPWGGECKWMEVSTDDSTGMA